jgi:hypothetical protein
MDATPSLDPSTLAGQLAIIRNGFRGLLPPTAPTIFDGSFIELDVAERDSGRQPPSALEKARARWRHAQIVE